MLISVLAGFALALVAPLVVKYARKASGWLLAILPAGLTAYYASFIPQISEGRVIRQSIEWVPMLGVELSFRLDGLSLMFALIISFVGTLIVIYAGGYLAKHPRLGRFYSFLLVFMSSMLGVVLTDDLVALYVLWELTSISSFFLIGFENEQADSRKSALQALLVTVTGGMGLLAAAILFPLALGTHNISEILGQGEALREHSLYLPILLLLCLAAFTKSAQFPFHFWLPSAMAAPTPVSAYLHSATMVKAGIYLMARMSPVLGETAVWHWVVGSFGGVTMLIAAWLALQKTDLKLVLAYSTVSVLGTLMLMIGIGGKEAIGAMVVYLAAHSFYKGALFMVVGSLDHEAGTRDALRLGKLGKAMPLTAAAGALAALSMAGLPPTLGFIGKEKLLEAGLHAEWSPWVVAVAVTVAAAATVAVAGIVGVSPFWRRAKEEVPKHPHEAPPGMWVGPILLGILGIGFALAPGVVEHLFFAPAAGSILREKAELHMALWHGVNVPLMLSIAALIAGLLIYLGWSGVRKAGDLLAPIQRRGPAWWYDLSLVGLNVTARSVTSTFQTGSMRHYLRWVFLTTVGLICWSLVRERPPFHFDVRNLYLHEWILALLITAGWMFSARMRSGLGAILAMGIVGYAVALIFMLFGAPDLSITQFSVETLVVILFVLVIYRLPRFTRYSRLRSRIIDYAIGLLVGGSITLVMLAILARPLDSQLAPFFQERAYTEAHGRNIVNVILVDFRAMDTLGEITVLGVAAIGVLALHRLRMDREAITGELGRRSLHDDAGRNDSDWTV